MHKKSLNKFIIDKYISSTKKIRKKLKQKLPFTVVRSIRIIKKIITNTHKNVLYFCNKTYYYFKFKPIFKKNIVLLNRHKGERCFILGTGPSINKQDLSPLTNETCIGLNSFHLHKDYSLLKPSYHLLTSAVGHNLSEKKLNIWFDQVEKNIPHKTTIFCIHQDYSYIKKHSLLSKYNTHYFGPTKKTSKMLTDKIDATKEISQAFDILVTALDLAIYMGFKSIYVIGADHHYFFPKFVESKNPPPSYFFDINNTAHDVYEPKRKFTKKHAEFITTLWQQYYAIKRYAHQQQINIYNATPNSHLDVFPFVNFEDLFVKEQHYATVKKQNNEYTC
jgi:hypothetical protein